MFAYPRPRWSIPALAAALVLSLSAHGQPAPALALRRVALDIDSGPLAIAMTSAAIGTLAEKPAFSADAYAAGSTRIELDLTGTTLPQGAVLTLTSLLDDAGQVFTAETLAQWGGATATFNGPAIRAELWLQPGAATARLHIAAAIADVPGFSPPVDRTICGTVDDRQPSADNRVARTGGQCTAWMINDANGGFLTAGHCRPVAAEKVYFNVPASTSSGSLQLPPPDDQYLIDQSSIQSNFGALGDDWCYFGVLPNTNHGLTPRQRYGAAFDLQLPASTAPLSFRITGYGTTSSPIPATRNQTQQTHTGPFSTLNGSAITYMVDTTGGNSGSPIIDEAAGVAVGIHTNGGCTSLATSVNTGTALNNIGLQAALRSPAGVCRTGAAHEAAGTTSTTAGLFAIGDDANNFGPLILAPADGPAPAIARRTQLMGGWQGMAWDPRGQRFLALRSLAAPGAGGLGAPWLWQIHPAGQATPIARLVTTGLWTPSPTLTGLAFDPGVPGEPGPGVLYAMEAGIRLRRIIIANGEVVPVATFSSMNIRAIDFDPLRRVIWGIHNAAAGGPVLIRIDPASGQLARIGAGLGLINGVLVSSCADIAFDPTDGRLLSIDQTTGNLLRIDPDSGLASLAAPAVGSFTAAHGLASAGDVGSVPRLRLDGLPLLLDRTGNGNRSGSLEPGESSVELWLPLINVGPAGSGIEASPVLAQLTSADPAITISSNDVALQPLAPGQSGWTLQPFRIAADPAAICGQNIPLRLTFTNAPVDQQPIDFALTLGNPDRLTPPVILSYVTPSRPIPDNAPAGIAVPVSTTTEGIVGRIEVSLDGTTCTTLNGATTVGLSHANISQLRITLTSPSGTTVSLLEPASVPGIGSSNLCGTRFSDSAGASIGSLSAPFSGAVIPAQPLSAFRGQSMAGTWTLRVIDTAAGQTGTLRRFSVHISPDQSGIAGPAREFSFRPANPLAIPDNSSTGATATFAVQNITTVGDVELRLNGDCSDPSGAQPGLRHPRLSDLTLQLISPDNTTVTLATPGAASTLATGLCSVLFDDDSPSPTLHASVPAPEGLIAERTLRPASPLAAFAGRVANGTWRLKVIDSAAGQTGSLADATLIIHDLIRGRCFAPATPCPADINQSGELGVQDLFDFLDLYLAAAPAADFNASGAVTLDDLLTYLQAFIAGCA